MKFGIIQFDGTDTDKFDKVIINIGDAAQLMAIENIYAQMGVSPEEIVYIDYYDLETYDGDYVVVPVNLLIIHDPGNKRFLRFSPRIVPVFLGVSFSDPTLGQHELAVLRKYEPIGCRDQRSMDLLRSHGIEAYVNGCLALTLPRSKSEHHGKKIIFADVPASVLPYVPEELYKDIEFVDQEVFDSLDSLPNGSLKDFTKQVIEKYETDARLIVTSRFHGAVLGMALGIPVIVTLEQYTYRFSWIKNIVPFYTEGSFDSIDWNPSAPDLEPMKQRMIRIAIDRIEAVYRAHSLICDQSAFLECGDTGDDLGQIPCYAGALGFIRERWKQDDAFRYSIWGINKNAEDIYQFIRSNYPNAVLAHAYDMFNEKLFHGVRTKYPSDFEKDEFVFVAAYLASQMAPGYFAEHGVNEDQYYLCKRSFIGEADIRG